MKAAAGANGAPAFQTSQQDFATGGKGGAPERIRTPDLRLRRATLYPAELLAHDPVCERLARTHTGLGRDIDQETADGNAAERAAPSIRGFAATQGEDEGGV